MDNPSAIALFACVGHDRLAWIDSMDVDGWIAVFIFLSFLLELPRIKRKAIARQHHLAFIHAPSALTAPVLLGFF